MTCVTKVPAGSLPIELMLGHADINQTKRYLNITDEELRKAMTGVWERRRQLRAVGQLTPRNNLDEVKHSQFADVESSCLPLSQRYGFGERPGQRANRRDFHQCFILSYAQRGMTVRSPFGSVRMSTSSPSQILRSTILFARPRHRRNLAGKHQRQVC
jgi:hypothetical protein